MFGFFLRFLIIIYALWLLRRLIAFFTGAPKRGRARSGGQAAQPQPASHTVKDPVCGMYMDPRLAVRIDNGNGSFFFCSKECKEKYLSQPR
jgi:YHS domain-containing protein